MKKTLKMLSCFLTLCTLCASLAAPVFAVDNICDTVADTNSVKLNKGLSYSIIQDDGYTNCDISKVADQDISSYFYAGSSIEYVPQFTVDLGEERLITNLVFYGGSAWQKCALNNEKKLQYSADGKVWETVAVNETRVTTTEGVAEGYYYSGVAFINQYTPEKNVSARYLRIVLYDIKGYNINEIAIYGADPSDYTKSLGIGYSLVDTDSSWNNVCDGSLDKIVYDGNWSPTNAPTLIADLGKVYDLSYIVSYAQSSYQFGELENFEYSLDKTTWISADYGSLNKRENLYKKDYDSTNVLYTFTNGIKARYIRFQVKSASKLNIHEICIYGKQCTDDYVTAYKKATADSNKVSGAVSFQNRTGEEKADKCYLTVVYIGGSIYKVFVNDRSGASVINGTLGDSAAFECELPENTTIGNVTAKTFVLNNLTGLQPETEPLTLS